MTVWLEIGGRRRRVDLPASASGQADRISECFAVDGKRIDAEAQRLGTGAISLLVEGRQYHCVLDDDAIVIAGRRVPFSTTDPRSLAGQRAAVAGAGGPRLVKAPMPGLVVRVLVEAGEAVEEHQGLVVIEAMKMQNELKSPKRGRVVKVAVVAGTTVSAGAVLALIE